MNYGVLPSTDYRSRITRTTSSRAGNAADHYGARQVRYALRYPEPPSVLLIIPCPLSCPVLSILLSRVSLGDYVVPFSPPGPISISRPVANKFALVRVLLAWDHSTALVRLSQ